MYQQTGQQTNVVASSDPLLLLTAKQLHEQVSMTQDLAFEIAQSVDRIHRRTPTSCAEKTPPPQEPLQDFASDLEWVKTRLAATNERLVNVMNGLREII